MKKSLFVSLLALSMAFSACGPATGTTSEENVSENSETSQASSENGEESTAATVDTSQNMDVSIFIQADDVAEGAGEESPVIQYWSNLYNLTVEWQKPPQGSESEQLNMMLGTGDYTDVIDLGFNTENLTTLCDDGVIYELSEYIDQYMPNYKKYLEDNPDVASALYDDDGHIYNVAIIQEDPKQWGGLVYRRDILDTMTDGSIQFPSGEDEPTTIADWEYMLDLMKQYFDQSGMTDTACLIIPASGYFATGELMAGFGIGGTDYVDNDGNVRYGIAEDAFYNYLTTMRDWYKKGYVYADFASRSQDLFYLPNTALTYGGAAGVWYGLDANLGNAMSVEEYGLEMDVQPMAAPIDEGHGVTEPLGIYLDSGRTSNNSGFMISTACDEEKLIRILNAFDYFYSEEGAATRTMGLSSEQGAGDYEMYQEYGLPNGTREPGTRNFTPEMAASSESPITFGADRMPGISISWEPRESEKQNGIYYPDLGDEVWTKYGNKNVLSMAVSLLPEETDTVNSISTAMTDYANGMVANFIMGREELNEDTFAAYQEQLKSLGLEEYLSIKQGAYDRYLARAK